MAARTEASGECSAQPHAKRRDGPGVAAIFRAAGEAYRVRHADRLDAVARHVMASIERCRTAELGGVIYRCTGCGHRHAVWKSCGNRHCPSCQGAAAHKWMERQAASILPVPYFHVVFTLPRPIARIAMQNRKVVFNILFRTAGETLRTISADPKRFGARVGGTAVLHTWNQRMEWHPHVHCLVPNGGFDVGTGEWKVGSASFFAPVKVLGRYFRRRFLEELAKAHAEGRLEFHRTLAELGDAHAFRGLLQEAREIDWVVYAKPPFRGPEAVFKYLSRYTHRVAIGDSRILAYDGKTVAIRFRKPARKAGQPTTYGTLTLPVDGFLQRFLLHCIPKGFHRIRHFGILANGCRAKTLEAVGQATGQASPPEAACHAEADQEAVDGPEAPACPLCGEPSVRLFVLSRRQLERPHRLPAWLRALIRQRGPPEAEVSP